MNLQKTFVVPALLFISSAAQAAPAAVSATDAAEAVMNCAREAGQILTESDQFVKSITLKTKKFHPLDWSLPAHSPLKPKSAEASADVVPEAGRSLVAIDVQTHFNGRMDPTDKPDQHDWTCKVLN